MRIRRPIPQPRHQSVRVRVRVAHHRHCQASRFSPKLFQTVGSNTPGLSSTLESQFLDSVSLLPAEFSIQATAVIPHDRQAKGHWLLVTLLCHRVFDACGDQVEIRNFGVFYHATFGPGDVFTAVSRKVIRDGLTWLEATVTRDGAVVATASPLYDQADSHWVDNPQVRDANRRRTS
ncbi:hypothetical protein ASPCAL15100 [Aspergillus calidoustus]|uniref:Thioesterase domain-containing protein n=1 Tax=Aspergillus calidoustus TaxID=454130 RepID=A0A0U5GJF6_ASPCI|nr:hypothetical protein ASPCAL15100 [Aspergillus calidoustus]